MNVKSLIILILLAAPLGAMAQRPAPANDTVMKGTTIEVIQSYKPKVKQAPKPEWIPQLPPSDTTHPSFTYDVPQQTLYYSYSSLPLRPLALGRDTTTVPFRNYIKLGGGNLSTIFLDAGIGGIAGDGYEVPIHIHHLSQKGDIKYQQTALSGLDADALLHRDNSEWRIGINGERDQYYNYGYENTQSADSLKQTYITARLSVDMKNKDDKDKINYHPAISASYYGGSFSTSEVAVDFAAPFTYKLDPNVDAAVEVKGSIANYTVNSVSTANNIFALVPGIKIHGEQFKGHALIGFAAGQSNGIYVLPDILASYAVADSRFIISAGWQSTLRQNTYEQLSTENPYMTNAYAVLQTRKDEIFLQAQGSAGDHFTFSGRLSSWNFDQLPVYLNDSGNQKQFRVLYDRVNAISFQAAVRYQVANSWSVGVATDFYGFSGGTQAHVYGEPTMKFKADFMAIPVPKLYITAYFTVLDGIYATQPGILGVYHDVKLNAIANMGFNVEYQLIPRLSLFAQVNNLFNDKYQRWRGYESYGLNVFGGLRLKF